MVEAGKQFRPVNGHLDGPSAAGGQAQLDLDLGSAVTVAAAASFGPLEIALSPMGHLWDT